LNPDGIRLLDSSGWLEFFIDGPNAKRFRAVLEQPENLLVPTIVIYEVCRKLLQILTQQEVLAAVAIMRRSRIIDLDESLAIYAATISQQHKLAMADSIILAVAQNYNAEIWTQDQIFSRCLT
jgi:predicted nucleic acid-binding protein